jgi:hypothetical protein
MRSVIFLSLFLLAGCAAASRLDAAATPAQTLQQIRTLIGNPACTDTSQCRSLPLGARACGGPQGYLAWSTAQTDGAAVTALAERYKAQRQVEIKEKGEMSDCRFLSDPGATCVAGTCQLGASVTVR